MTETVKTLRRFLEHAPKDPGNIYNDLLGWQFEQTHFICATCAGRILARGCALPKDITPVWADSPKISTLECEIHTLEVCNAD